MTNAPVRPRNMRRPVRRGAASAPLGVWMRLPECVVEARAGLIPSEETDGNPPPDCLTYKELLAWHRGQPVFLRASRFVEWLGTAKLSRGQQEAPVIVKIARTTNSKNSLKRRD